MCSELVSTCRFRPSRWSHICSVVEPPLIITPSPGVQRPAAARPMASFWRRLTVTLTWNGGPLRCCASSGLLSASRAPPCTRTSRPSTAMRSRSRRRVAGEASIRVSRSRKAMKPRVLRMSVIARSRSVACIQSPHGLNARYVPGFGRFQAPASLQTIIFERLAPMDAVLRLRIRASRVRNGDRERASSAPRAEKRSTCDHIPSNMSIHDNHKRDHARGNARHDLGIDGRRG